MFDIAPLKSAGLFDQKVPRYTSYPPATQFHEGVGATQYADWIASLEPGADISLYVHIPFCYRLCWFCACRTQGINSDAPVEAYLNMLEVETKLLAATLPEGVRVTRMHWGGGSPTVLQPEMIRRLTGMLRDALPLEPDLEFSVEIDPTSVDSAKIAAFKAAGMTRASIGVQDFDPKVQAAIGREQSFAQTHDCIAELRAQGIASINIDLVYGLAYQDQHSFDATLDQVLQLSPDRIALFGYAHVPWMAKRQQMIPGEALPGTELRFDLFNRAAKRLTDDGMVAIGIDHFARPEDSLARAASTGTLRRNFQGYTDDTSQALLGLGASSISRLPQGYVQNEASTSAWSARIAAGGFASKRGIALSSRDRIIARAIEMLMCEFAVDFTALRAEFGTLSEVLAPALKSIGKNFGPFVRIKPDRMTLTNEGRPLARIIAAKFDTYEASPTQHSMAI